MALDDFGAVLQSGMGAVPDLNTQLLRMAQTSAIGAQAKLDQAQAAAVAQKQSRAQQLQAALAGSNGSPQAVSRLIMAFPEFADQLKSGFDVQDKAQRDADLTSSAEIYSAAASGNWELAKKLAHTRYDAEKAAGHSDPSYDSAIQVMDDAAAGDPDKKKAVLNLLGTHLAAVTGPEHFGSVYGALKGGYTLEAGATRYDENGNEVARSPFFKGQDGTVYERDGHAGSSSAPAPATAKPDTTPGGDAGFDPAVAFTLKHEGGYNPHDLNGAPVNFGINQGANPGVDVKSLTADEAKDIYKNKYWAQSGAANLPTAMQTPYFDTYIINPTRAQQFLKASGGDPNKFMDLRETWMNSIAAKNPQYAKAYQTRNADLRLTINGQQAPQASPGASGAPPGYHVLIPGKQPTKRILTDAEATARGLPLTQKYQIDDATGDVSPISNTTGAGGEGGPLKPDALRAATVSYIKTGKMPAGMGGQALKNQILNFVPTIMDEQGLTPDDIPSVQQQFGADSAAFKQRVGQLSYMRQSLGKLNQHAQDLGQLIKAVPAQTQVKPLNWITQSTERQFSNSTIAQLDAGLPLFQAEVARVMTGNPNSGAGQLSDNARHEFESLSSALGPAAKIDALNRIMKMTEEAVKATRDETGALRRRIGGGIDVYAGKGPQAQPQGQDGGWITLPSGLKIRKIK